MDSKQQQKGLELPVVEEFYSIQGEGFHTGKAAYFIRLGGCDIGCEYCDTKFSWNPDITPSVSINDILGRARTVPCMDLIVTGGEPLLYNLDPLCNLFKQHNYTTYIETSGSHPKSGIWDWFCLSPKQQKPPLQEAYQKANELKVIIQKPDDFAWAEHTASKVHEGCLLYLQPEWSIFDKIIPEIVQYILKNPTWQISLQSHKFMHIP
jgi:organic radical activating enzyme